MAGTTQGKTTSDKHFLKGCKIICSVLPFRLTYSQNGSKKRPQEKEKSPNNIPVVSARQQ